VIVIECSAAGELHYHEYPEDWEFGGASGLHPGVDSRFRPSNYEYLDRMFRSVHVTSVPLCDNQALDEFTKVAGWGLRPVLLKVRRPDGAEELLPFWYDSTSDELHAGMIPL
jgi:hypothetical protein